MQTLTQTQKQQLVQFLANTVANLVQVNNTCAAAAEEQYFVRAMDLQEVIVSLQTLTNTMCNNSANYLFTHAQAYNAIYSYDTEYRECIMENLEFENNSLYNAIFTNTLVQA
jgi:hypothetical protein|tara:strand:- start:177 stop:512 length:336 start_codon:yes stop_codon:yes gene_type:complete